MVDSLLESAWFGPLLWAALYVSDYYLTLACARMYQAQEKVVFEGSYELTPQFQADVDALRRLSPRFLVALAGSTSYLCLVRYIARPGSGVFGLYLLVLGAMLLTEATVHVRHLRNWFTFRYSIPRIEGRIAYPRAVTLRLSAFEMLVFSVLYLGLFLVTAHLFVLGGVVATALVALNHYRLALRHAAAQKG